jgi:hypothetical protein
VYVGTRIDLHPLRYSVAAQLEQNAAVCRVEGRADRAGGVLAIAAHGDAAVDRRVTDVGAVDLPVE